MRGRFSSKPSALLRLARLFFQQVDLFAQFGVERLVLCNDGIAFCYGAVFLFENPQQIGRRGGR